MGLPFQRERQCRPGDSDSRVLAEEAARLRGSGALGRSSLLYRLFDYFVDRADDPRSPKEAEVAFEVFGKPDGFDSVIDASVRVYVCRLRKKFDEYYDRQDGGGIRLVIPRGEYRIALAPIDLPDSEMEHLLEGSVLGRLSVKPIGLAIVVALLLANLLAMVWFLRPDGNPVEQVARKALWANLISAELPANLVAGDYYIFGETDKLGGLERLVRQFEINSRDDLDQVLMRKPELIGRYRNLDLHYLPTGVGPAFARLAPVLEFVNRSKISAPHTSSSSELTADGLKGANIVYVGYLSGLGMLEDVVFSGSAFRIGNSFDELVDQKTRTHYVSDWSRVALGGSGQIDYGFIAKFKSQSGSTIIVIAGTRDAALMQMADLATNPAALDEMSKAVGGADEFEALYIVSTMRGTNLSSKLKIAYPRRAWSVGEDGAVADR